MKRTRILTFIIVVMIITSFSTIYATDEDVLSKIYEPIHPQSYVEEVIDYTVEIYSYDQWGNPVRIDSQTYTKTIRFPNGYELVSTDEEIDAYLFGFTVYTYYNYRTY